MKTKFFSLFIALMAIALVHADAQTVPGKARNQRQRIRQGVRSGELTRAEAVNLRNGQHEINQERREARADGVVTQEERREIKQDQRQQSRKIFRKKHNNRDRN